MGVDIIIQEDHFSTKYTNHYDLFIITGMDRFSFLIADKQSNLLVLKSITLQLTTPGKKTDASPPPDDLLQQAIKTVYLNDDELKLPYRSVKISLINKEHTFVPDRLFDASNPAAYLETMVKDHTAKNIHIDQLPSLQTRQIYQIDQGIESCLQQYFSEATFYHILSPMVLGLQQMASHHKDKNVYLHVRSNLAHIFLFEDQNFLFANSFSFKTENDFIYFVLLVYEQFKLDVAQVPIYYSGFILEDSRLYHQLYRYIRYLNPMPRPLLYKYGQQINEVPSHFFFDLYSLKLCE